MGDTKRAYEAWRRRMDKHWRHNYPAWENVPLHTKKAWRVAVAVIKEQLADADVCR